MDVRQREYHLGYDTVAAHQASMRREAGAERAYRSVRGARAWQDGAGRRAPRALLASVRAAVAYALARLGHEEAVSGWEA